jgi:hypothetical protein
MKKVILLILTVIFTFGTVGCATNKETTNNAAKEAFSSFLSGDTTLLGAQVEEMGIPDFNDNILKYEYTYLDVNADGVVEMLVQLQDDPCGYNAVFHFDGKQIICWQSDSVEGACRDYPLKDGTMVQQYDYSGTRGYTLFRYNSKGEKVDISDMFARDELIYSDDASKCPYYEFDGAEVSKDEFDKKYKLLIQESMLKRDAWKAI